MLLPLFCATQSKQQEWRLAKRMFSIAAELCKTIKVLEAGIKTLFLSSVGSCNDQCTLPWSSWFKIEFSVWIIVT